MSVQRLSLVQKCLQADTCLNGRWIYLLNTEQIKSNGCLIDRPIMEHSCTLCTVSCCVACLFNLTLILFWRTWRHFALHKIMIIMNWSNGIRQKKEIYKKTYFPLFNGSRIIRLFHLQLNIPLYARPKRETMVERLTLWLKRHLKTHKK